MKKFLLYISILVFILMVGVFSLALNAEAQVCIVNPSGTANPPGCTPPECPPGVTWSHLTGCIPPPGRCTNGATNYPDCNNNTTPNPEPLGTCVGVASAQYQGGNWPNVTRAWCDEVRALNPGATVRWTQNRSCPTGATGTYPNCVVLQDGNVGYKLIQPLPTVPPTFDTESPGALARYLNPMIILFIGLCAVAAVVMIVIGGIEYSTSELTSSKAAGKDKIQNALLGLLLALIAWVIINTINPDLLNTDIDLAEVTLDVDIPDVIELTPAQTGGGGGGGGQPVSVNIGTGCDNARAASAATGVPTSLILSIFAQESSGGRNVGSCTINSPRMYPGIRGPLQTILNSLGRGGEINTIRMSCAASYGYGGAIGYTQFLPGTWLSTLAYARRNNIIPSNYSPNPWNVRDALLMAAVHLRQLGAINNPARAACSYYAGPAGSCNHQVRCGRGYDTYSNCVVRRMADAARKCPG